MKLRALLGLSLFALAAAALHAEPPAIADSRLEIVLFASEPEIVTPIGAACDREGRLFVIESHTHLQRANYPGPTGDRVKVFIDADGDGNPERTEVFAEGITQAMNCVFAPDGALYIVCASEVLRLEDTTGDLRADRRTRIAQLRTREAYPHSKLLGLTFGPDGWLYISRGNTGGRGWTFRGSDGSEVSGYGDGGNVLRCRPDGSGVEEFATGFWNPFDLIFDAHGRLLTVDNDPDARGPNRLVHVVQGGDYGYQSRFGGGGNHPFQGWDGELPGTLPFVSGTGEAPSGLIDARAAAMPPDLAESILVTVWNEHTIERHQPQPRGVSIAAERSVLVKGGDDFRPVALAADPRGNLYVTDWVLPDYPNHGRGRIWRISARSGEKVAPPRATDSAPEPDAAFAAFTQLLKAGSEEFPQLAKALESGDAFLRHAAVTALARPEMRETLRTAAEHASPHVRLGALLALRRTKTDDAEPLLRRFLRDPAAEVRRAALRWAGEEGRSELRGDVDQALAEPGANPALFEAWLAAVACLDAEYVAAFRARAKDSAKQLSPRLSAGLVEAIVRDSSRSEGIRALAIPHLPKPSGVRELLMELATTGGERLRIEALRSLAAAGGRDTPAAIEKVAGDSAAPVNVRAEALLALQTQTPAEPGKLTVLLDDPEPAVAAEAARLLRLHIGDSQVRRDFEAKRAKLENSDSSDLREQLDFALGRSTPLPADDAAAWQRAFESGGDPAAGERVFFTAAMTCISCHAVNHRGSTFGPDLSSLGQSKKRAQIIDAIVRPSEEFAPQYQAWVIEAKNGDVHTGLQLDHKNDGGAELATVNGLVKLTGKEIARIYAAPRSLMPEGLGAIISPADFRNLVAFLSSTPSPAARADELRPRGEK